MDLADFFCYNELVNVSIGENNKVFYVPTAKGNTIKVMAFDSLTNIKPLCDYKKVTVN